MGKKLTAKQYYTYQLLDSRNMKAFYVGKGTGNRVHAHVRQSLSGSKNISNTEKHHKIKEIYKSGNTVVEQVLGRFADEQDALDHEEAFIGLHGIENLTNVFKKGTITSPRTISPQSKAIKDIKSLLGMLVKSDLRFVDRSKETAYISGDMLLNTMMSLLIKSISFSKDTREYYFKEIERYKGCYMWLGRVSAETRTLYVGV